jgi:hypothetical protein
VISAAELLGAVDAAFAVTGRGLARWPDPHFGRAPDDAEYSRATNPGKWHIVGARADAWIHALVESGLAAVQQHGPVRWAEPPGTVISRSNQLLPHAAGALPLAVARSKVADAGDAGVTLGVGEPAVVITWIPHCGCDACDSGSQNELDELDNHILGVITGTFRRWSRGNQTITVIGDGRRSASGVTGRDVDAVLADPVGWQDLFGTPWLTEG